MISPAPLEWRLGGSAENCAPHVRAATTFGSVPLCNGEPAAFKNLIDCPCFMHQEALGPFTAWVVQSFQVSLCSVSVELVTIVLPPVTPVTPKSP